MLPYRSGDLEVAIHDNNAPTLNSITWTLLLDEAHVLYTNIHQIFKALLTHFYGVCREIIQHMAEDSLEKHYGLHQALITVPNEYA